AVGIDRDDDLDRPDQLRQMLEQPGALMERLAHQAEVHVLEIADAAVDQLGGLRRRLRAAASLVEESDLIVLPRQLPGDSGTVDAAADDSDPHGRIVAVFRPAQIRGRTFESGTY